MENHLREHRFVLGDRPGSGDFGLYGQLTQLALFDPTPMATTLRISPRTYAWTELVEDLSGLEPESQTTGSPATRFRTRCARSSRRSVASTRPSCWRTPSALASGAEKVECEIDGETWTQKPFPYQGKCLEWLRRDYHALADADRAWIDQTIAGTGLERLFS